MPPTPNSSGFGRRNAALAAALIVTAAAAIAYSNSFGGPFVYDDQVSIAQNPTIHHLWDAFAPPRGRGVTVEGRPILNLSFAINYAISGSRVWSYHAANLLIHLGCALTLFAILWRTMERLGPSSSPEGASRNAAGPWLVALAASVLWAVHPLDTESVTYVSQRAASLMALFLLITFYGFIRSSPLDSKPRGKRLWAGLSIAACFFGMGTKEEMVAAPLLVLLYDRTFVSATFAEAWRRRKTYYLCLASSWIPLGLLVASSGGNRSGSIGFGVSTFWPSYELTQFLALAHYVRLAFWPNPLVFDYGPVSVEPIFAVVLAALIVGALVVATIWALRYRPALGFLGGTAFALLAPTSLLPGTTQMIVEHRMYLPLASVVILVVIGASRVLRPLIFSCLTAAACAALGYATFERNITYHSELALWSDTVDKRPDNPVARNNLGLCLSEAGRAPEAIEQFKAVLKIQPDYVEAHNNLGIVLAGMSREEDAIGEYRRAITLKPDWAEAHYNLAAALDVLGERPKAIDQYAAALKEKPSFAEAHAHLALDLDLQGQSADAIHELEEAVKDQPENADDRYNLGTLLGKAGRSPEAIAEFEEAARIKPEWPEAHYNLAVALYQAGQISQAVRQLEEAVRIKPDYAQAKATLQLLSQ